MSTVENPFDKVRPKLVAARIEFMGQLAKFSSEELTRNPVGEDEWTPLQLAYHLYVADGLALETMEKIQDEDNPLIEDLGEETPRRTREAEPPSSLDVVAINSTDAHRAAVTVHLTRPDAGATHER